ncbi:hypothetical protein BDY19DRAFT_950060, partial [Irpex rosettiformis]
VPAMSHLLLANINNLLLAARTSGLISMAAGNISTAISGMDDNQNFTHTYQCLPQSTASASTLDIISQRSHPWGFHRALIPKKNL